MYYSKVPAKKTPVPFAEFRVWIISQAPIIFNEKFFDGILDRMEHTFVSFHYARKENKIYFIEGKEENVRIDSDEALVYLSKTGVRAKFGVPYRQVQIWLRGATPATARDERVYNEADIIEAESITERDVEEGIREDFGSWKSGNIRTGVYDEDQKL